MNLKKNVEITPFHMIGYQSYELRTNSSPLVITICKPCKGNQPTLYTVNHAMD